MRKVNIKAISSEVLGEIFEAMAFDEVLAHHLDKIDNHPKLTDAQKREYHNKRVSMAFHQEAKRQLGDNLPYLKKKLNFCKICKVKEGKYVGDNPRLL